MLNEQNLKGTVLATILWKTESYFSNEFSIKENVEKNQRLEHPRFS